MIINMWSGPRNLSTALMRSFENRKDTNVWDEPLYAYYLKNTKLNHPLANKIINKYKTNIDELNREILMLKKGISESVDELQEFLEDNLSTKIKYV